MGEYLYLLALVFLCVGNIKAGWINWRLPRRRYGSLADAMASAFEDLDKVLKPALPWYGAAFVTAALVRLF